MGTDIHLGEVVPGDLVVWIDSASMDRVSLSVEAVGSVDQVKVVTRGRLLDDVTPHNVGITGAAMRPLPPDNLHASGFGGDITLSWRRQDKVWTRSFWTPANSDTGTYTVDILDSTGAVVRTLTSSTTSVVYTAAQQTTDFGGARDFLRWRVAQMSTDGLTGFYASTATGKTISWENLVLSYSPAVFLRFNEAAGAGTILDYSGNGNHGTNPDSYSQLGVPGAFGSAIDLSVDNDFGESINLGNDLTLRNMNAGSVSVCFWVKSKMTSPLSIASVLNQGVGIDVYFVNTSGTITLYFKIDYSTTDMRAHSNAITLTGDWQFFACVLDSATKEGTIYVDGVEVSGYQTRTSGVGTPATSADNTIIGAVGMEQFLDEFFVVPVALTPTQINALIAKRTE